MNSKVKFLLSELLWAGCIFLGGGLFNGLLQSGFSFHELLENPDQLVISGIYWVVLWKGNEYVVNVLDLVGPKWVNQPKLRFFLSFFSSITYTIVATFLILWSVHVLFYGKSYSEFFEVVSWTEFFFPLLFALFIGTFFHGRGFLYSWREAALNVEKLKTEQVSTQFESLKSQVNPHFLFNSLNALSSLVYEDQDKAVKFIRKLSDVYRYVLDQKDKEVVKLEEELEFVQSYVYLQKIRFQQNLIMENRLDKINGIMVAPLSIQLLIENAIKHNVISEKRPLKIQLDRDKDYLTVRNNVQRKSKETSSTGIGLHNLRGRYEFLSDKKVEVLDREEAFEVRVPILSLK